MGEFLSPIKNWEFAHLNGQFRYVTVCTGQRTSIVLSANQNDGTHCNLRQLCLDILDRFTFTAGDSDSIKSIFHAVCSWPFLSIMSYMYIPVCCWWLFLNNHRQCLSSHANYRLMLACVNSWITNSIFLSLLGDSICSKHKLQTLLDIFSLEDSFQKLMRTLRYS